MLINSYENKICNTKRVNISQIKCQFKPNVKLMLIKCFLIVNLFCTFK